MSGGDKADDQQEVGMPGEGESVSLTPAIQVFLLRLHLALKPLILMLHALRAIWYLAMRVRCPKPLDFLLFCVVLGWCSLIRSFLIMSRLFLLTARLRHLILQVVTFRSRLLVRVHVWHWYVRLGITMELVSLTLVLMRMFGCFRSGASK